MKILLDTKIFAGLCFPSAKENAITKSCWQTALVDEQVDTDFWIIQESLNRSLTFLSHQIENDESDLVEKYLKRIRVSSLSPQEIYQINKDVYRKFGKEKSQVIAKQIYIFHRDFFDLIITPRKEEYLPFLDINIYKSSASPVILFSISEYLGHLKVLNSRKKDLQNKFIKSEDIFSQNLSRHGLKKEKIFTLDGRDNYENYPYSESPSSIEDFLLRHRSGVKHFSKLNLNDTSLSKENLRDIYIDKSEWINSELTLVNLLYSKLKKNDFNHCKIRFSDLREAIIEETDFGFSDLSGCNLRKASLCDVNLSWSNLQDSDLSGIDCRNTDFSHANLDGVNFSEANLDGVNFQFASLNGADFKGSSISLSNFRQANLNHSQFDYSFIIATDFNDAELTNSDFSYAELLHSTFTQSVLINANFHRALISGVYFDKNALLSADNILIFFKNPEWLEEILNDEQIYRLDETTSVGQDNISLVDDLERRESDAIAIYEKFEKDKIEMVSLDY